MQIMEEQPRGQARLMMDPLVGRFIIGHLIFGTGMWIHSIVAALVVFQLTQSSFMVAIVSVALFGPQVLSPASGALADRGSRRLLLAAGLFISGLGSGGLALWIWAVGLDGLPGAWPVVGSSLVVGIGVVLGQPALQALVPGLVRSDELAAAVALNTMPMVVGRALGPLVGVATATVLGPALAFVFAAAGSLVFALLVLSLPLGGSAHRSAGGDPSILSGLRHLTTNPVLVTLLLGVAAVGFGSEPSLTLAPILSEVLGDGTNLVGAFSSAFGIGMGMALLVSPAIRRLVGRERLAAFGLWLMSAGLVGVAVSAHAASAIVAFAVAGAGMGLSLTSLTTQLQERLPDAMRGRIMALWLLAWVGSRPIAAVVNGALADAASAKAALVVDACVVAVAALSCRSSRLMAPGATPITP